MARKIESGIRHFVREDERFYRHKGTIYKEVSIGVGGNGQADSYMVRESDIPVILSGKTVTVFPVAKRYNGGLSGNPTRNYDIIKMVAKQLKIGDKIARNSDEESILPPELARGTDRGPRRCSDRITLREGPIASTQPPEIFLDSRGDYY